MLITFIPDKIILSSHTGSAVVDNDITFGLVRWGGEGAMKYVTGIALVGSG
jgi:hypothetical protein